MEIIYSTRTRGFQKGKSYRNPRYFAGVESGVKSVVVEGKHPDIVKAYEEAKVPVKTVAAPKPDKKGVKLPAKEGDGASDDDQGGAKSAEGKGQE